MASRTNGNTATAIAPVTNDAQNDIDIQQPYIVTTTIEGTCPVLFHAWSNEAVAEKAAAAKGSAAKKTDNVESYVHRDPDGYIGIPGVYLKGALAGPAGAAKFRQDPRSPRKSALDLYKAGVIVLNDVAPIMVERAGVYVATQEWDYLDARRVTVQRAGVTRMRPAFMAGWRATFEISVLTPEYISRADLRDVLTQSGKLVGLADFRPSFGRFGVVHFDAVDG